METLPPVSSLSPSIIYFLDGRLQWSLELHQAPTLLSELRTQCSDLDNCLTDLSQRLGSCSLAYINFSGQVGTLSNDINSKLIHLRSASDLFGSISDGGGLGKLLAEELPALAKEVARVEAVRVYAVTPSKLDTLVGDIEDAVSSSLNRNVRKQASTLISEEVYSTAIKALKLAEDVLTSITKTRPQWVRLVSVVDHGLDRALAILRPQTIADHRSLLTFLGWPPPLTISNSENADANKSSEVSNPLFTMQGDLKHQYCESFLALCSLQELQGQRKTWQLQGHNREVALHQPLWAIEELVHLYQL